MPSCWRPGAAAQLYQTQFDDEPVESVAVTVTVDGDSNQFGT